MPVKITQITAKNAALLDRVADDVFDDEIDAARVAVYLGARENILVVAVDRGVVVGQARGTVHRHPDAPNELYVDNLGVTHSHLRCGIATGLMKKLFQLGQGMGCAEIWLATEMDNEVALGFYRALGLQESRVAMFVSAEDRREF